MSFFKVSVNVSALTANSPLTLSGVTSSVTKPAWVLGSRFWMCLVGLILLANRRPSTRNSGAPQPSLP